MANHSANRTMSFRWNSRYELYSWFKEHFGLEKKQVDEEIHRVMPSFRPRKHQVIKTQELWQKVGLNLEKAFAQFEVPVSGSNPATKDVSGAAGGAVSSIGDTKTPQKNSAEGNVKVVESDEEVAYLEDLDKGKG